MKKAYLVLADGHVFEGRAFGAESEVIGELVPNTSVVGYMETLTDPNHAGQIVMQTFPMIGNYGVIASDAEGECRLAGYVVREICDTPSNFRSEGDLDAYLKRKNIPGICGVDTRAIMKLIREKGIQNAMICAQIPKDFAKIEEYTAETPTFCTVPVVYEAQTKPQFSIAALDFGLKRSLVHALTARGCTVTAFAPNVTAEDILASAPNGLLLSDGPGDPTACTAAIETVRALLGKLPIYGIGKGMLILGLACGGAVEPLMHGHYGANHPVRDVVRGRTYITAQASRYRLVSGSVAEAKETYVNLNDQTCEGIDLAKYRAFGTAFAPKSNPGAADCGYIFDKFFELMGGTSGCPETQV